MSLQERRRSVTDAPPDETTKGLQRHRGSLIAAPVQHGVAVTTIVVTAFSVAQDGALRLVVDPVSYGALLGAVGLLGLAAGTVPTRAVLRSVRPV